MTRTLVPIFILLIFLATIAGVILVKYQNDLTFNPSLFVNEIFKFFFGILTLVISFLLGQVYWEQRERRRRNRLFKKSVLDLLQKWKSIVTELNSTFQRPVKLQDYDEVGTKFEFLSKKEVELETLKERFVIVFQLLQEFEDIFLLNTFYDKLAPLLKDLCKAQESKDIHLARVTIDNLCQAADELLQQFVQSR